MTFHLPTFLFQVVNFLVLVALLRRLVWIPLSTHIKKRAEHLTAQFELIENQRQAVRTSEAEVDAALHQARRAHQHAKEQARAEVNDLLDDARRSARAERDLILSQMEAERARQEDAFLRSLAPEVGRLAEAVLRSVGSDLHAGACRRLAAEVTKLSEGATQPEEDIRIETATDEIPAELESALSQLSPGDISRVKNPDLIAGARVRIGNTVIDGSVKNQIDRVIDEVSRAA